MRGGRRQGAGRKPGSTAKRTKALVAGIRAKPGMMPIEVMLLNMEHFLRKAEKAEQSSKDGIGDRDAAAYRKLAQDCAVGAAPYIHARLAAIEHTGKGGGPLQVVISQTESEL